jgi:hypothetical protein
MRRGLPSPPSARPVLGPMAVPMSSVVDNAASAGAADGL